MKRKAKADTTTVIQTENTAPDIPDNAPKTYKKTAVRFFRMLTASVFAVSAVPVLHAAAADAEYGDTQEDGTFVYGWNYNNQGTYEFQKKENGSVSGSWEGIHDCVYQSGIKFPEPVHPETCSIRIAYHAELEASGACSYGIHGFSEGDYTVDSDPIEFFVIEGGNGMKLPADAQPMGTVTVEDNCYDMYVSFHTMQTGIEQDCGYMQYWSVRQNNAFDAEKNNYCMGNIALSEHIRAWQGIGAKFDEYAVAQAFFEVESFDDGEGNAAGTCVINDVNVTLTEPDAKLLEGRYLNKRDDGTYLEAWEHSDAGALYYREEPDGGCFAQWADVTSSCVRSGMYYPEPFSVSAQDDIRVRYEASLEAKGTVWYNVVGLYHDGFGRDGEFYVVEGWDGYRPCSDIEPLRTVEIGGVQYDIYHTVHVTFGIDPPPPVPQYWSIRRENAYHAGTNNLCKAEIPLLEHMRAWDREDAKICDWTVSSVFFEVNGYHNTQLDASGICRFTKTEVTITPAERAANGDVNKDGNADVADAVMIAKFLGCQGDIADWEAGDLNGDRILNAVDLTMFKQILMK